MNNKQIDVPDWCPPIPEGWEVMDKDTYRGGEWLAAEVKDPTFEKHPDRRHPRWDITGGIYIQPKESA